jgi:hypothetical protein
LVFTCGCRIAYFAVCIRVYSAVLRVVVDPVVVTFGALVAVEPWLAPITRLGWLFVAMIRKMYDVIFVHF